MKEYSLKGALYATSAYFIWGLFALYWKLLSGFPPLFLLAFRILMACITIIPVLIATRNTKNIFIGKRNLLIMIIAGLLLGSNWYLYIYAVTSSRVLDASLAYYMNPLMSMALGIIILRERKTILEYSAIFFAALGVAYRTYTFGSLPLLSIAMGGTFALYGFIKKQTPYNVIQSTTLETVFLALPSLIYVLSKAPFAFDVKYGSWILLLFSGVITTVPLILFGNATKLLKISNLGFFQFITPIMTSCIGIFLYKEPFHKDVAITFLLIVIGVMLYIVSMILKIFEKKPGVS